MSNKKLQLQQLDARLIEFAALKDNRVPSTGWIKAIRSAIGMSLSQMGKRLNITKQSAQEIETRERDGNITINTLRETARVLDMQLVYGFVPVDGSLEAMIDKKAKELAKKIVMRTSNSMVIEDQGNNENRLNKAIDERAEELKRKSLKILWD